MIRYVLPNNMLHDTVPLHLNWAFVYCHANARTTEMLLEVNRLKSPPSGTDLEWILKKVKVSLKVGPRARREYHFEVTLHRVKIGS